MPQQFSRIFFQSLAGPLSRLTWSRGQGPYLSSRSGFRSRCCWPSSRPRRSLKFFGLGLVPPVFASIIFLLYRRHIYDYRRARDVCGLSVCVWCRVLVVLHQQYNQPSPLRFVQRHVPTYILAHRNVPLETPQAPTRSSTTCPPCILWTGRLKSSSSGW